MEKMVISREKFEPELYCLRCQRMEWDDDAHRCANFQAPCCPLGIRLLLKGMEVSCVVV